MSQNSRNQGFFLLYLLNDGRIGNRDPDPYLWLMDPDPGGPKTRGSGTLITFTTSWIFLKFSFSRLPTIFSDANIANPDFWKTNRVPVPYLQKLIGSSVRSDWLKKGAEWMRKDKTCLHNRFVYKYIDGYGYWWPFFLKRLYRGVMGWLEKIFCGFLFPWLVFRQWSEENERHRNLQGACVLKPNICDSPARTAPHSRNVHLHKKYIHFLYCGSSFQVRYCQIG